MDIDGILPQDADYIMAENSEFMTEQRQEILLGKEEGLNYGCQ